jgi:anti-anti-sigma factor
MASAMELPTERFGPIFVATVQHTDTLTATEAKAFGALLDAHVEGHPSTPLLLNLLHVTFLSSAILSEVIRINNRLQEKGASLRLCGLNENIQKVFAVTHLDTLFHTNGPNQARVQSAAEAFIADL